MLDIAWGQGASTYEPWAQMAAGRCGLLPMALGPEFFTLAGP